MSFNYVDTLQSQESPFYYFILQMGKLRPSKVTSQLKLIQLVNDKAGISDPEWFTYQVHVPFAILAISI